MPRADPRRGAPGVPYADNPRCRDRVVSTDQSTPACVARPPRHAGMTARPLEPAGGPVAGYLSKDQAASDLTKRTEFVESRDPLRQGATIRLDPQRRSQSRKNEKKSALWAFSSSKSTKSTGDTRVSVRKRFPRILLPRQFRIVRLQRIRNRSVRWKYLTANVLRGAKSARKSPHEGSHGYGNAPADLV